MNPFQLLSDPIMKRAINMAQGKSTDEIKEIVRNLAKERGISDNTLTTLLNQLGLKL